MHRTRIVRPVIGPKLLSGVQYGSLVLIKRLLQLLVGVDQAFHRLVVWCRILRCHIPLDAPGRTETAIGEFLDEVGLQNLGRRRRSDNLFQKLG